MATKPAVKSMKPWSAAYALLGATLATFSIVNLSGHAVPVTKINEQIVSDLTRAATLPAAQKIPMLVKLRTAQEDALASAPAEPFAWARLAYLRYVTQGDMPDAFAALSLSDLVSPDEPRQLPERALMWQQFAAVETPEQRAYQTTLWEKAFGMQRDMTWDIAKQNQLGATVKDALKRTDPELYEEWKARENAGP